MKTCCRCNVTKSLDQFGKHKLKPDGHTYHCKECNAISTRNYYLKNLDTIRQKDKEDYYLNRDKYLISLRKYYQKNKPSFISRVKARRCAKKNRTPSWLSDLQTDHIILFYEAAQQMSKETGIKFHVDHIVPLQGENVSGLHVPWNLQVISEADNLSKGNRF